MQTITQIVPVRVWPLLARSDFLHADGNDPKLASIVASTEITTGRFDLLLATLGLFNALVNDILTNAVHRKAPKSTNGRRFAETANPSTGLSERVLSKVILTLTQIYLDVLPSSQEWTFSDNSQKPELSTTIL